MSSKISARKSRARRRAGSARQAVLAGLCLAGVLAAGLFVMGATGLVIGAKDPVSAPQAQGQGDGELYTGTVQLAPGRANRCQQLKFDNQSGRFQDGGIVPCGRPATFTPGGESTTASSHLDQIRQGFRNR